jgi:hypothetical protein
MNNINTDNHPIWRCPHCFYDFGGKEKWITHKMIFKCPSCEKTILRGKVGYRRPKELIIYIVLALIIIVLLVYELNN